MRILEVTELESYETLSGIPLEQQEYGLINSCEKCCSRGVRVEAYHIAKVDHPMYDPPFNIRNYRVCTKCLEGLKDG